MIDENLPTFYLRASRDNVGHHNTLYLSHHGSEAAPTYTVRHPDPTSVEAKNRYAVALYDCYNPDILYGEVLSIPEWNQPTLSAEEIRKNGGVPPPPQPILPNDFTVQLYNPDQQVVVKNKPATWKDGQYWRFELPQQTFRQPSSSALDKTQNDPALLESTPTIDLLWRREGKFSKDMMCYYSGKLRNPDGSKNKHKEPDIPVAYFRNMREMTIYESNLQRIDVEDPKGFEVVVLLSAFSIKDIYFGQMAQTFNISETGRGRSGSGGGRRSSGGTQQRPPQPARSNHRPTASQPLAMPNQRPSPSMQISGSRPPPTDPRSQWEIDAETARLKKQAEMEERERRKKAEQTEKERKKQEKEDAKRARQLAEEEERAARKRREAVEKETEKLKQEYYAEQKRLERTGRHPQLPPRHSAPLQHIPFRPPQPQQYQQQYQQQRPQGPFLSPPPNVRPQEQQQQAVRPRRSGFFGLMGRNEGEQGRLTKKQSAIF